MSALVFVDTNIFLDFYRVRGRQGDLALLDHIDQNHDRVITGSQIQMEFKKNRPNVILETYRALKPPDWSGLTLPAFLARSRQSSGLDTGRRRIDDQLKALRTRLEHVFENPARFDPVYRVAQRLFRDDTPHNLSRSKDARFRLRRLACKRHMLGYPPRKPDDNSIGDAVNWEWIIQCALNSGKDVVLVSRDGDFGLQFGKKTYLNDWLKQEFKDRVSRRRSITLTDRLAEGLKQASISVTKKEERAESEFLEEKHKIAESVGHTGTILPTVRSLEAFLALRKNAEQTAAMLRSLRQSYPRGLLSHDEDDDA